MHFSTRLMMTFALVLTFGAGCGRTARMPLQPKKSEPVPVSTSSSQPIAFVQLNGGIATLIRDGETVNAEDGAELESGDRVRSATGTVSIVYPDTGVSNLDPGSEVTVIGEVKSDGIFAELRLAAGRVWTRFEKVFGADDHFSVAANGVVATVRGTGFGVGIDGEDVDVQVAENTVEVAKELTDENATSKGPAVAVTAGEGIRLRSSGFVGTTPEKLRMIVRKLTVAERQKKGFLFGASRLPAVRLLRPARTFKPFRNALPPNNPEARRLFLLHRAALLRAEFQAPTRAVLPNEIAPTSVQPILNGPNTLLQ